MKFGDSGPAIRRVVEENMRVCRREVPQDRHSDLDVQSSNADAMVNSIERIQLDKDIYRPRCLLSVAIVSRSFGVKKLDVQKNVKTIFCLARAHDVLAATPREKKICFLTQFSFFCFSFLCLHSFTPQQLSIALLSTYCSVAVTRSISSPRWVRLRKRLLERSGRARLEMEWPMFA